MEFIPELHTKAPQSAASYLKRLYYDTALSGNRNKLICLRELVDPSRILYGTIPSPPHAIIRDSIDGIESFKEFDGPARGAVERDNALALFPRLPFGLRRRGPICVVAAPHRPRRSPSSRLLASGAAALATRHEP